MTPAPIRLLCALALASCVCAAGCTNEDKQTRPRRRDRISRSPDPVISREPARRDTTYDRGPANRPADRLSDRRGFQEVPTTAERVDTGGAAGLEYEPSRDGVMYVYDEDDDRVVFVGRMRDRERFRLEPDGNRALINSKTVYRGDLNPRHHYRLYFDRA
jgi:hypothetical protein